MASVDGTFEVGDQFAYRQRVYRLARFSGQWAILVPMHPTIAQRERARCNPREDGSIYVRRSQLRSIVTPRME